MSLFASIHTTGSLTPDEALAAAFPNHMIYSAPPVAHVTTLALQVTARFTSKTPFDYEVLGIEPKSRLYFVIDKEHSVEARQELAAAVGSFLSTTTGDVVVMYLDVIILKRIGAMHICAEAYLDMLPNDSAAWKVYPELEQP